MGESGTYQLFVAEAARFGQPFQKLGKRMVERDPLFGNPGICSIDFSSFQGSVVLSGPEEFAALVILVRPDQFATLPVGKQLAAVPDLNRVE